MSDHRRRPTEVNAKSSKDKGPTTKTATNGSEKERLRDKRSTTKTTVAAAKEVVKRTAKVATSKKEEKIAKESAEEEEEEEETKKRKKRDKKEAAKNGEKESSSGGKKKSIAPPPKSEQKKEKKQQQKETEEEEEVEQYEEDFEQYESDFDEEADIEEADNAKHRITKADEQQVVVGQQQENEEEDPAKSSLLLRRIAEGAKLGNNRTVNEQQQNGGAGGGFRDLHFGAQTVDDHQFLRTGRSPAAEMVQSEWHNAKDEAATSRGTKTMTANLMDYYLELVGKREGRAQACTQTAEQRLAVGTQTERTETESKETQRSEYWTAAEDNISMAEQQADDAERKSAPTRQNRRRLNTFLKAVEHLVDGVLSLAHKSPDDNSASFLQHNSNLEFSSRFSTFSMRSGAFFKEGRLCAMAVKDAHTVAAVLFVPKSDDLRLHRKSFIAEFSMESAEHQPPQRVLRCEQEVVAFRYSADNFSAAFAGLKDGSIVAWDLLAEEGSPLQLYIGDGGAATTTVSSSSGQQRQLCAILSCFDTAFCSLSTNDEDGTSSSRRARNGDDGTSNHRALNRRLIRSPPIADGTEMPSPIVALEVLSSELKAPGVLAQLITLYESGTVRWWTALYGQQHQREPPFQSAWSAGGGGAADLEHHQQQQQQHYDEEGAAQIKMVPMFSMACFGRLQIGEFPTCLALLTVPNSSSNITQSSKILVGTSAGQIVQVGRGNNERVHYYNNSTGSDAPEEVTSIRSCPLINGIFAVVTSKRLLFYAHNVRVPMFVHSLANNDALFGPTLFEWCPSAADQAPPVPFLTVHGGEMLHLWKYKRDIKRLQSIECDLRRETNAKVRATMAWTDQTTASSFVTFLLSDDRIQIHCLERDHSTDSMQFIDAICAEHI